MINCKDCKFWTQVKQDRNWGECRKNAPLPLVGAGEAIQPAQYRAIWAFTRAIDGCSEGKAANTALVENVAQDDIPGKTDPNTAYSGVAKTVSAFDALVKSARKKMGGKHE